ncbi:hypothetical protein AX15_002527 [Amanita polypyramis BW_CC]|nr:hypothetical protein AX15_002527 [Amanita polypyramis BW_CC]
MQSNNSCPNDVEAVSHSPRETLCDDDSSTLTNVWVEPSGHSTDSRPDAEHQTCRMGFWDRLTCGGGATVGWKQSIIAIATHSWLNVLLIFVPLAWVAHLANNALHRVVFALTFIALLPLIKLLHYAGDQLALNCSKHARDVIIITVNNFVETVLAIILLVKCDLKLLQSTITGFILLRLLLISGMAFITGGWWRKNRTLHPSQNTLNRMLLLIGTLMLLLPALFYNTLDRYTKSGENNKSLRDQILVISRGLSPMLLVAYICSCCYISYPPGSEDVPAERDVESLDESHYLERPEVNFWTCLAVKLVAGSMMVVTAEFLISNLQPIKDQLKIRDEFFGIVLIPVVSFSADALLVSIYFIRSQFRHWLGAPRRSGSCAVVTRSIDLSIQFMLFWTPLLVLIAWILDRPLSLLFNMFEVILLLAAGFLVNCVTFDSRVNWAQGVMLVTFYLMIAITSWFYPGGEDTHSALSCAAPPSNTFV